MPESDAQIRLATRPAPFGAAPTVVTFTTPFNGGVLAISYVPDRDLLVAEALSSYLRGVATRPAEQAVATIAADIANELVPRWHRVTLTTVIDAITQTIAIEDRQPGWDHPSLLTAVPRPGTA